MEEMGPGGKAGSFHGSAFNTYKKEREAGRIKEAFKYGMFQGFLQESLAYATEDKVRAHATEVLHFMSIHNLVSPDVDEVRVRSWILGYAAYTRGETEFDPACVSPNP